VKFISQESERQIIGCAADYILHLQKGYALECFSPWTFNGAGQQVPEDRIIYAQHIETDGAHS
jgi:hypothetical protein